MTLQQNVDVEHQTGEIVLYTKSSIAAEAPKPAPVSLTDKVKPAPMSMTDKVRHAGSACLQLLSGKATPFLIACACLAVAYRNRNRPPAAPAARTRPPATQSSSKAAAPVKPVLHRSVSMAALQGGRVALQRILDSQEARINEASMEDAERHLRDLLAQEPLNFRKLNTAAAKLEMSGKEGVAVDMLRMAWEKADKVGQPHEAHELQMLLVEMLIYKGEYEQALKCNCLYDKEISDARGALYKAIIYCILNQKERAKECYEEFQSIRTRFYWPESLKEGSPLTEVLHEFSKFEGMVNNLKKEIEQAHKTIKSAEKETEQAHKTSTPAEKEIKQAQKTITPAEK